MFTKPCDDMGATYTHNLYYCEVGRLFHAKVIKSIYELKVEIIIVIKENQNLDASIFRNDNLVIKLICLEEISGQSGVLN